MCELPLRTKEQRWTGHETEVSGVVRGKHVRSRHGAWKKGLAGLDPVTCHGFERMGVAFVASHEDAEYYLSVVATVRTGPIRDIR